MPDKNKNTRHAKWNQDEVMPDIFVSYAHVDNQLRPGAERGWVSLLVDNLKIELSRELGRESHYDLWMDKKLHGNDEVQDELKAKLKQVDTLVIMMSEGWLSSKWCQWELKTFLAQERDHKGRIFLVNQVDCREYSQYPEILKTQLGYPFWYKADGDRIRQIGYPVPKLDDQQYFDQVLDLAKNLSNTLKTIATPEQVQPLQPVTTVFVAPTSSNFLNPLRKKLITELQQYAIAVLPENNDIALESITETTQQLLPQCSHFIQLLDENDAFGIPARFYQAAQPANIPILQWRNNTLDLASIHHTAQKALLNNEHVVAANFPQFMQHARQQILHSIQPAPETPQTGAQTEKQTIFVHAGPEDMPLAERIAQHLQQKQYGIALPRYSEDPAKIRKTIERGMMLCDTILLLHKLTDPDVIEDFLADAASQAKQTGRIIICQGEDAEPITFIPPQTEIFTCSNQFDDECLAQFFAAGMPA